MIETETKIDEIDKEETEKLLSEGGARCLGKKLMKRWIFVLPHKEGVDRFIRVRSDGKKATLTYKRRSGSGLANTMELETVVEDFDETAKIFAEMIGEGLYQENYRTMYTYHDAEITIDEWPKIPPVVEIEAKSEGDIRQITARLGIKGKELGNISWEKVYAYHGIDLNSFKILKFDD